MPFNRPVDMTFQKLVADGSYTTLLSTVGRQVMQKVDEAELAENVNTITQIRRFRVRRTSEVLDFINDKGLTVNVDGVLYNVRGSDEVSNIDLDILTVATDV